MSGKTRAGIAGIVGAVVAFGVAELVHGLYSSVPSVFVALVQGIIEFTPGELVTSFTAGLLPPTDSSQSSVTYPMAAHRVRRTS